MVVSARREVHTRDRHVPSCAFDNGDMLFLWKIGDGDVRPGAGRMWGRRRGLASLQTCARARDGVCSAFLGHYKNSSRIWKEDGVRARRRLRKKLRTQEDVE